MSRYWKGRNVSCAIRRSLAASASWMTSSGVIRSATSGPGPPLPSSRYSTIPRRPFFFSPSARLRSSGHAVVAHLTVRVHDQDGVEFAGRQPRVFGRTQDGLHVPQAFTLNATLDRLDHLPLHVLGVDAAVGAHTPRETDREPAAARTDVGDERPVTDPERVHDAARLLPCVPVRPFEQAEVARGEQPAVPLAVLGPHGWHEPRRDQESQEGRRDRRPARPEGPQTHVPLGRVAHRSRLYFRHYVARLLRQHRRPHHPHIHGPSA